MISPEKWKKLREWMVSLGIDESELEEKFILGSGRGGQNLHKTASCVYLCHKPSQLQVKCQKTRAREANRYWARRLLCEKIDALRNNEKSKKQQTIEKLRRQKRKRSKRAKEKILAHKAQVSVTKQLRKKPQVKGVKGEDSL